MQLTQTPGDLLQLEHAILGPSGSKMWLTCTPSIRASWGKADTAGDAAKEGSLAHYLSECILQATLGMVTSQWAQYEIWQCTQNPLYKPEMSGYVKDYVQYVLEVWSWALGIDPRAQIFIERKWLTTRWVPAGFGKADITIVAGNYLIIIDFKYGQGVKVSIKGNEQTRLYALGALDELRLNYPIQHVVMHIYQPRMQNIGKDTITAYDLWEWAENYVKPRAILAWNGQGEFVPGSHCTFCKAKPTCRAHADFVMTPTGKMQFPHPNTVPIEELEEIALKLPLLVSYSRQVMDYLQAVALKNPHQLKKMKLVEGRSNRYVTDEKAAIEALQAVGYKDVVNSKIKGFGDLAALYGDANVMNTIGQWVRKPEGKPTLVPADDDRGNYQSAAAFFGIKTNN